jgi:site-specific recombinase XerD
MSRVNITEAGELRLEVLGAKGGRERELTANTESQRDALERYLETSKQIGNVNGKLIPPEMSARQMYDYQRNTIRVLGGTKENGANMHVLRHQYAQNLDKEGKETKEISEQLGHSREEIVNHYR